jgi:hypothetical protein
MKTAEAMRTPVNSKKVPAYLVHRIIAIALLGAMTTCVDHRPPTSSTDLGIADSQATATLVSATITHTLLTAGTNPTNTTVYTTASISPAPNTPSPSQC